MYLKSGVWSRMLWLFILTILGGEILSDAFLNLIGLNHTSILYSVITNLFLIGFLLGLNQLITKQPVVFQWAHQSKLNWIWFGLILLAIIIINLINFTNGLEPSFLMLLMSILSSLLGSIFEETFFRGILLPSFLKMFGSIEVKKVRYAILVASLLFALINISNGGGQTWLTMLGKLGVNFTFATLLCLVYIKMRSIWFPIIIHWIWNFMTPYGLNLIINNGSINNLILIQEGLAILSFLVATFVIIKKHPLNADLKWLSGLIK